MMIPYVEEAASRGRESWGPGAAFGAFLIQLGVTAGFAFSLGLLSIIRRERDRWFGAIPCLIGGLYLLWFAVNILAELWWDSRSAIHRSLDLTVGILMALIGVFFLVWLLPKASARLARELEADDVGETNTRAKMKAVKLFGIATLVVGVGLILIHVFGLL